MESLKSYELPQCPVETTVLLIGDRWKILIIRELLKGTHRFGDLAKGLPGISNKVLTQHLRALESRELVEREVFAEVPVRVEYSLTTIGWELQDVIDSLWHWGEKYQLFATEV
ncbi:helix-turn-helix transcriptional regulator [Erysipelothrix sp. HDW6C]|uniref:winged helix-turn-helix transcriptional regulator n=1 Tax=Erysipelothrix sp. HDW6C TaxID=2714930 RepID=UPI0014086B04|nr:helix-turn-helix domain-containing protein [Erysipelothrix sp. HDW6C]QIK69421.1 helix-turn-helix transcriptional regulator [Erysipelothrix sp. HDW6C]